MRGTGIVDGSPMHTTIEEAAQQCTFGWQGRLTKAHAPIWDNEKTAAAEAQRAGVRV